jgi:hypothetical protein
MLIPIKKGNARCSLANFVAWVRMTNSFTLHETHKQLFSITGLEHGMIQGLGSEDKYLHFLTEQLIHGLVDEWK